MLKFILGSLFGGAVATFLCGLGIVAMLEEDAELMSALERYFNENPQ